MRRIRDQLIGIKIPDVPRQLLRYPSLIQPVCNGLNLKHSGQGKDDHNFSTLYHSESDVLLYNFRRVISLSPSTDKICS